jgi:hypothetical protein
MNKDKTENDRTQHQRERNEGFKKLKNWLKSHFQLLWEDIKNEARTVKFWLEVGALTGLIAYTAIAFLQWRAQISFMKNDERAWVAAVEIASPPEFPKIEIGNTAPTAKYLVNFGKTPGIQVIHKMEERIFCNGFPDDPPYRIPPQGKKVYGPSAGPIWPNEKIQMQYEKLGHPITEQEWNSFMSGDCLLFLYGTVNYCDVFGKAHYQHFCSVWYTGSPHNFMACTSYNDGDAEHHEDKLCPVKQP